MDINTMSFFCGGKKKSFLKQACVAIFHLHLQKLKGRAWYLSLCIAEVKVCILLWLLLIL